MTPGYDYDLNDPDDLDDLLADLRRAEPTKNPNIGLNPNDPAWDSRWDDIEGDNQ